MTIKLLDMGDLDGPYKVYTNYTSYEMSLADQVLGDKINELVHQVNTLTLRVEQLESRHDEEDRTALYTPSEEA